MGKLGYAPNPVLFQNTASTKLASTPLCSHSRTRTYTTLINSQVHYSILLCENICFHMRTWTQIYKSVACRSIHWTMWKIARLEGFEPSLSITDTVLETAALPIMLKAYVPSIWESNPFRFDRQSNILTIWPMDENKKIPTCLYSRDLNLALTWFLILMKNIY